MAVFCKHSKQPTERRATAEARNNIKADNPEAMHRLMLRTSQEKQQQGSYSIILSFDLAYQTEILNNQGGKLENHLFKELQQYLGVNPWVCLIILWDWLLKVLKTARLTLPSYVYGHGWKNEFKTSIDAQNFGRD